MYCIVFVLVAVAALHTRTLRRAICSPQQYYNCCDTSSHLCSRLEEGYSARASQGLAHHCLIAACHILDLHQVKAGQ